MWQSATASCELLIYALGHTLWQSVLISGVVWSLLRRISGRRSELRYAVTMAGLIGVVASGLVTLSVLQLRQESVASPMAGPGPAAVTVLATRSERTEPANEFRSSESAVESHPTLEHDATTAKKEPAPADNTATTNGSTAQTHLWQPLIPILTTAWLIGAFLMLFRGLRGFVTVRSWVRDYAALSKDDLAPLTQLVNDLCDRFGLRRRVRLVATTQLDTPAAFGFFLPVILIPVSMISGVTPDQWQIILAHELAHIRRWDAVSSLLQLVVESLLFFNPSVWWLNRMIRAEREACCDAMAARVCGQPLSVARTLINVAASVHRPNFATMAFAERNSEGELTDRVQRLVDPDRIPQSRVSWLSVILVLATLITTLLLLQQGTSIAVRTAANWMSPKERVDKLVQLEIERNGAIIPGDDSDVTNANGSTKGSSDPNAGKIPVHITVKAFDGRTLSPVLRLTSQSVSANSSFGMSLATPDKEWSEHRLTKYFPPGRLRVGAEHPDLAAAVSPEISLLSTDTEKAIELVLQEGITLPIQITDQQSKPVPAAWLKSTELCYVRRGGMHLKTQESQTDSTGLTTLVQIDEGDYSITVSAPGFQRLDLEVPFSTSDFATITREKPYQIKLQPATSTTIRVMNAATETPVSGATFRLISRVSGNHSYGNGFSRDFQGPYRWSDYGTTNEQGVAVLNELEDSSRYTFAVYAPSLGVGLCQVEPGNPAQTIRLRPAVTISGKIEGELGRLEKHRGSGNPGYAVQSSLQMAARPFDFNEYFPVDVDADGRFEIRNLPVGQRLVLYAPHKEIEISLKESLSDFQINIPSTDAPSTTKLREVVLRMIGTLPEAPARGTLSVNWEHPTERISSTFEYDQTIKGNEVRLQIPIGASLNYHGNKLVGYRIDEQYSIKIVPGSGPQIVEIATVPAGAIYGTIRRADGTAATNGSVSMIITKLPSTEKDYRRIWQSVSQPGAEYLRSVPLGGSYRLIATERSSTGCVWKVGDEITIDENNPIVKADFVLPSGKNLTLKLVDKNGKPVASKLVELDCTLSSPPPGFFSRRRDSGSQSTSLRVESTSDENGMCVFHGLSLDQPVDPFVLGLTASVRPGPNQGVQKKIEDFSTDQPVIISLPDGLTASGTLIETGSGKPIPFANVLVHPRDLSRSAFPQHIKATTDSQGNFQFQGLEPIEYTGYVEGGLIGISTADAERLTLYPQANNNSKVQWEVELHPGGPLKPLE